MSRDSERGKKIRDAFHFFLKLHGLPDKDSALRERPRARSKTTGNLLQKQVSLCDYVLSCERTVEEHKVLRDIRPLKELKRRQVFNSAIEHFHLETVDHVPILPQQQHHQNLTMQGQHPTSGGQTPTPNNMTGAPHNPVAFTPTGGGGTPQAFQFNQQPRAAPQVHNTMSHVNNVNDNGNIAGPSSVNGSNPFVNGNGNINAQPPFNNQNQFPMGGVGVPAQSFSFGHQNQQPVHQYSAAVQNPTGPQVVLTPSAGNNANMTQTHGASMNHVMPSTPVSSSVPVQFPLHPSNTNATMAPVYQNPINQYNMNNGSAPTPQTHQHAVSGFQNSGFAQGGAATTTSNVAGGAHQGNNGVTFTFGKGQESSADEPPIDSSAPNKKRGRCGEAGKAHSNPGYVKTTLATKVKKIKARLTQAELHSLGQKIVAENSVDMNAVGYSTETQVLKKLNGEDGDSTWNQMDNTTIVMMHVRSLVGSSSRTHDEHRVNRNQALKLVDGTEEALDATEGQMVRLHNEANLKAEIWDIKKQDLEKQIEALKMQLKRCEDEASKAEDEKRAISSVESKRTEGRSRCDALRDVAGNPEVKLFDTKTTETFAKLPWEGIMAVLLGLQCVDEDESVSAGTKASACTTGTSSTAGTAKSWSLKSLDKAFKELSLAYNARHENDSKPAASQSNQFGRAMATATFAFPTPQYADTSSGQPAATSAGLPAQTAAPAPTGAPFTQIDSTQFVDVFEELTFDTRQSNDTRQSKDPTGNVSNLQGHTDSKPTPTLYPIAEEGSSPLTATQYPGTIRGPPATTGNVPDPALPTAQKQSSLRNPQPPANTAHTNQSSDPKGDSHNLQDSLKDQSEHPSVEDSSQDGGGYDAKSIQGMNLHPDPEKGDHSLMEPISNLHRPLPPSSKKRNSF